MSELERFLVEIISGIAVLVGGTSLIGVVKLLFLHHGMLHDHHGRIKSLEENR